MKSKFLLSLSLLLFVSVSAFAQQPEDALRLAQSGYGISGRSAAMGNAMTGLAQGFDAAYFNPAGLAQSRQSELEMGLNFLGYKDNSTYLGNSNSLSNSQTDISNIGLVYPFPTTRGSFVIAFGYNHGPDYNSALAVSGFNPNSSIIPSLYYGGDTLADIAYMDFLQNASRKPYVTGNVYQNGKIYNSGGLNNWLGSVAMDIAHDFSVGLTINLISGKFNYSMQNFQETGVSGDSYDTTNFNSFLYNSQDNQDISGWNAKLGMLYRLNDASGNTIARFGLTIQFPSYLAITDNYSSNGTATFGSGLLGPAGSYSWSTTNGYGQTETPGPALQYDVTTPFKLAFGVSGGTAQLTAAAEVEYVDWTQLEFSNFNVPSEYSPANSLNAQIKQEFTPTANVRVGLEYALTNPEYSLLVPYLRAGFDYLPSPYNSQYTTQNIPQAQNILSGGVGVKIQNSIGVDLAYQYGWWNTVSLVYPATQIGNVVYPGQSTSSEKVTNSNLMFTFKYNF